MIQTYTSHGCGTSLNNSFDAERTSQYIPPSVSNVRPLPPAVYSTHTKRISEGQRTDATRVQNSFSSADTESSSFSYKKHRAASSDLLRTPPTAERTVIGDDLCAPAQVGTTRSQKKRHARRRPEMMEQSVPTSTHTHQRQPAESADEQETDHALWILFWLSALDPIHSTASCLFTLVVMFGLLMASPIRLIHKQSSLGDQLIRAIAPLYKNHLEMIYAPSTDYAHEWDFSAWTLVVVELASPFVSIGVVLAAWVSAAFWVFTFIMGNPDGTERGDDGRDAVLSVRNWWEGFLLKATRNRKPLSLRRSSV